VTGVIVVGVRGHLVAVEAHVGRGLPSVTLTTCPERVCKPSTICSGGLIRRAESEHPI
jgi:hypothetical protein